MSAPNADSNALLTSLLREVSRSFYLTMRVLPRKVRSQIGLAYLLARTTDTIADTDVIPVARRLEALDRLRNRILSGTSGGGAGLSDFGELAGRQASASERILLERVEESLAVLRGFSADDRKRIRNVLETITSGQELDLRRFDGATANRVIALKDAAELDDYTYRVAGCVGEFWTRMCTAHLFPTPSHPGNSSAPGSWFEASGVQFGKGLQLVNILRDLPRDLRTGRCYLPGDALATTGLKPGDLLDPANEPRLRPVYDALVDRAESFLRAGWDYTCAIPAAAFRLRLACAWPVLIGARTLAGLRQGRVLDPAHRIKVGRAEVRGIVIRSVVTLPFRGFWRRQFNQATRRS